jgi:MFS family permease
VSTQTGASKEYKAGAGGKLYILIVCTLLLMVNFMDRQVVAAVVEPMKAALGLSDSEMGVLGTVFLLSIAVFSFPISYLIDRWSRRKAVGIMALLWSLLTAANGFAWNFWSFLIPRSLVGLGEAGFVPGGSAMIGAAYSKKARGIAMGVFNAAVPLGVALGSLAGGIIAKQHGWQAPFFIFAIPGIVLGLLAFFMMDYKTVDADQSPGARVDFTRSIGTLFKIPTLVWTFVGYGLANIMSMSFLFWSPAFIGRAWGVDVQAANSILVPIVLAAIIGSPLGGFLADLWFRRNPRGRLYVPAISIILSAFFLAAALLLQLKGPMGMAMIIVYGILNVMAIPCIMAMAQDVAPIAQKGLVWGAMIFFMYVFGGGWSPYLVGAISDALGQDAQALGTALIIASLGGVLGGICYFMASRPYITDMDRVKHEYLLAEK